MIPILISREIARRHDSRWHPGMGDTAQIVDAFRSPSVYWQRQRSGVSRNDRTWSPGLGELSTAEIYARRFGLPVRRRSLGQQGPPTPAEQQVQQISSIASAGAASTVTILSALGVVGGPVGAVIGSLIGIGSLLVGVFRGCGQTCVEATDIVNQVEPILQQNVQAYVNSPVRTVAMQQAAANNFMTGWNAVVANCNNPQLLSAGQNCIKDREQGSCAYKTSPGGWTQNSDGTCSFTWPGANGSGTACWNWFVGYLDPIQNDPCVQPDSAVMTTSSAGTTNATSAAATTGATVSTPAAAPAPNYGPLLLIGAGVLLAWLLL